MQVVFHLGAPATDNDALIRSLLRNRVDLAKEGVEIPTPAQYRDVIKDMTRMLDGVQADAAMQRKLFEAAQIPEDAERIVFSDSRFVCINRLVVKGPQIWSMIARVAVSLRNLFPQAEVEFMIGMRDPATLIHSLFQGSRFSDFDEFTSEMQPLGVAWSEMLIRLRNAVPDTPVTVWCNEDTPLIWGEIMREMAGVEMQAPIKGVDDLVRDLMEPAGFRRMQGYLSDNPPENEMLRRRIVAAFLEKYIREEELEEELNAPGWSQEMVEAISSAYEADMDAVARIPGVHLISP